jgi:hypothetical protein
MNDQSSQQYNISYWYLQHKSLLKKILLYLFILIIAFIWIYFSITLIQYLVNISKTKDIYSDLGKNYVNYRSIAAPQNILINQESLLNAGNNKYDAFAVLKNPNNYWGANITYQFNIPGVSTTPKTIFILPQDEEFITDLNLINPNNQKEISLQVLNQEWKGVKAANLLPQVNIVFNDAKYEIVEFSEDTNANFSKVSAELINNDIYGYKDLKVTILLLSQNIPQGVNVIYLNDIFSNEKRNIEFNWPRKFPYNVEIKFDVETDVLDKNNLILK